LAALFRAFSGIGPGRVHQRDHRQAKPVGQFHQPDGFAIAFGPGHAEIPFNAALGVTALFVTNHHYRLIVEPGQPANHCQIVSKVPVAGQQREVTEQGVDIIHAMWSFGVSCHLAFAPGGQALVKILKQRGGFLVQRCRFLRYIHFLAGPRQRAQFLGLAFDLGQWFFEIQI